MKLNTTNEKLTRVLLSANPVLAHYKGSVRAVRMFFNMLGMKCKVFTCYQAARVLLTSNDDWINGQTNDQLETLFCSNSNEEWQKYVRYGGGGGTSYGGWFYNPEFNNGTLPWCTVKVTTTAAEPTTTRYARYATISVDELQTKSLSLTTINKYVKESAEYCMTIFNSKQAITEHDVSAELEIVYDIANSNIADLVIQITNVTDKNLQPVKSMLAKQLQEILPINMIVRANNIVGIESDE